MHAKKCRSFHHCWIRDVCSCCESGKRLEERSNMSPLWVVETRRAAALWIVGAKLYISCLSCGCRYCGNPTDAVIRDVRGKGFQPLPQSDIICL